MVKPPEQSYVLWFTQRVGSTLTAQAFAALADDVSDAWYDRFLAELRLMSAVERHGIGEVR